MTMPPVDIKRVALTGATGFLGSHIADQLLARNHEVRASVRPASSLRWLEGKAVETVNVNLNDAGACVKFVDGCDAVIHCAGLVTASDEAAYRRANVETTECLLKAAAEVYAGHPAGHFVFISSMAAHGPAGLSCPAVESNQPAPLTAYGRSKHEAEKEVLRADWPFRRTILRPPSLYGPRDKEFLPLFKAALKGWTARLGTSMSGLSLVDGRDAASAAIALMECLDAEGIFFVDDGHTGYDWDELRAVLAQMAGRKIRTLKVPLGPMKLLSTILGPITGNPVLNPDRIHDLDSTGWVCDGSRLTKVTGWRAHFDATTGFIDTLQFMKEQNWL